jgi:hypothetical protein
MFSQNTPATAARPRGVMARVVNFAGRLVGLFEVARALVVAAVRAVRRPRRRPPGTSVAPHSG